MKAFCRGAVLLICLFFLSGMGGLCEMEDPVWDVTNPLTKYANGVRNPLKGLRADADLDTRFGSLVRWYIKWSDLEQNAADGVERIIAYSENNWGSAHLANCKIIPRVFLEWPDVGKYWPEDLEEGDYTSPAFQERLEAMVRKMGQAWDNDPRIAYIEMGLIGYWGEQHTPNPSEEVQQVLISAFHTYFKNKLVMVRYPKCALYDQGGFGMYWDEWGSDMQWSVWEQMNLVLTPPYKDRWKTQVYGGENTNNLYTYATDGGRFMTFGCPEPFDAETAFTRYSSEMIKYAHLIHANHMHTRLPASSSGLAWMNACIFQDTLGYAFSISEARFSHIDEKERKLALSFDVKNTGSSPFYYDWPVRVSLLEKDSLRPVWSDLMPGVSVMDWMPGEEWQEKEAVWAVPPRTYTVSGKWKVPAEIENGEYVLALSIVDPAGLKNAAVFLNTGYVGGGYTALGLIGVGAAPEQTLHLSSMIIPQRDYALRYDMNRALHADCTAPALTDGFSSTQYVSDGTPIVVDLARSRALSSVTLAFEGETAPFSISVSRDGEVWTEVDLSHVFWGRNGKVHLPLEARARYLRLSVDAGAVLSQVHIYGS